MDVLGPDRTIESTDLGKLVYLERVIKETMRFFPAGPIIARAVTGDIQLGIYCMLYNRFHNFYFL